MSGRSRHRPPSLDAVRRGTIPSDATADELVHLIERINPTGRGLPPRLEAERYRLKAQLQSQLLRTHFHSVSFVLEEDGILALALRVSGRSAAHVPLEELDGDVRALVHRALDTGAVEEDAGETQVAGARRARDRSRATEGSAEVEQASRGAREHIEDLLDVWDHAPILALARGPTGATPLVRLAHALVRAREGEVEQARKLVGDATGPRAAEVWCYLGESALAAGDADRMVEARAALAHLDPASVVLGRLEGELERRRREELARRDEELRAALEVATSDQEREELAAAHLDRLPGSKFARGVLDEVATRRVLARREQLLARAAGADAAGALELLRQARAEGAEDLEARIQRKPIAMIDRL